MFTKIQAYHYRSLCAITQTLGRFQALVGPNASGKTTFLDTISLLGDIMRLRGDVNAAVSARSSTFDKLVWKGTGHHFQIAVEATIPEVIRKQMMAKRQKYETVRYEVEIGLDREMNEIGFNHETLWLVEHIEPAPIMQRELFPTHHKSKPAFDKQRSFSSRKTALKKSIGGNDTYYPEGRDSYQPSFKLGRRKAALANLPADSQNFPVSTWFRDLLESGVQTMMLNSQVIRQPSPPGLGLGFKPDGSNLPWVIDALKKNRPRFDEWLDHVRTALPDIQDIDTVERDEDRHRYLIVKYASGAEVPAWLVSDGTLRLLALTILAYSDVQDSVYLIEEPENGIHPRAIEAVVQSLGSIYESQVLMATHSPVALNMLDPTQILCFAKDREGATDVVAGNEHPVLGRWKQGLPDVGTLFASGILG